MHTTSPRGSRNNGFKPVGRRVCAIALLFLFTISPVLSFAASADTGAVSAGQIEADAPASEAVEAEEHLSPGAMEIFSLAGVPVTNSMITGWLATLLLILVSVRFRQQVRLGRNTRFTAAVEMLVVFLDGFLSDIMGKRLAKKTFWLLASFFIFILCSNLLGLFPGIGSVGWGHSTEHMFRVSKPLFRGVNADLNTTLAMGAVFFLFWLIWAWKANGPVGILKHIFGFQGEARGIMHVVMAIVFFAVGFLELISILIRPVALALRLYGNIFAGEVMLDTMLHKVPAIGWLLPVPFYLMEVLVGLIQALVFMLLSAVFIVLICSHGDENDHSGPESAPDA